MATQKPLKPGYYATDVAKSTFTIPTRYQNLVAIGCGAYGQVCSADDQILRRKVAIKKVARPFQTVVHAKRTYRELRMLKHMNHDNIIGLFDVFTPSMTMKEFGDVYLVTHLMDIDMAKLMKTQHLTQDHVQFFIYQILRGLKYVHSAGVIHRDLKTSNIAVNEDNELRILDFGLARQTDDEMTGYVFTRWYRAPEVILSWTHYDTTADVWSVGCIMAEMLTGKPLFPGNDHIDQLMKTMSLTGKPPDSLMDRISSDDAKKYVASLPNMKKQDFAMWFKGVDPVAIDLLERMLELDPAKRITAEEALAHPYMKNYADPEDEPQSESFDEAFEKKDLDVKEWEKTCAGRN